MEKKTLTNEHLRERFTNQFDLVNYAIQLAENMIHSGREPLVRSDKQNKAFLILEEIRQRKDMFKEVEIGKSTESEVEEA